MKKKMLFVMATIVAFALFVPGVTAATIEVNTDLSTAVSNASSGDTLKLTDDLDVSTNITIEKELILDLNGHDITFLNKSYLLVESGNLTVTGKGNMVEDTPYYAPIMVKGSTDSTASNYSVVTVGEDVYLEGWAGVFVRQSSTNTAYGVNITVNGTINTKEDADGGIGSGIYVNGSIKHTTNAPVITLGETAVIESVGAGVYAAGYAVWNINGASITGVESGLAIKAGKFNITDGTITATGEDSRPTEGYNNGVNPSGSAIQVESNNDYAGNIELNISGGNFISENGVAIYEYLSLGKEEDETDDTTVTSIESIEISGGNFQSEEGDFELSNEFNEEHSGFVSGGTFSDGNVPEKYLATDKDYIVTGNGEVLLEEETSALKLQFVVNGEVAKDEDDNIISGDVIFKKGYTFTNEEIEMLEEEIKLIEEAINEEVKEYGYVFLGLYTDAEGKNKVDFTKSLDEDTIWYIVIGEEPEELPDNETGEDEDLVEEEPKEESKEESKEELPPKTSDINIVMLIGTIVLGTLGIFAVSKKRFAKSN